jgi:hypothetical protein
MVAVIAGRASLGTEAACRAFTDSNAVSTIRRRLAGTNIDLEDHGKPFCAPLSMLRKQADDKEEVIPDSPEIWRVEGFTARH